MRYFQHFEFWGDTMQVSVENISKVERRLTVVVPANIVEEAYQNKINVYAKKATLKGFRPGKAPLSIVQQRFGQDARTEALNDVIQGAIRDALAETKLRPINMPRVEPKKMAADQALEFTLSFEIFPELGDIKCEVPALEKLAVDISDEDIQHVIKELLKQHTKWNVVERDAQKKDRVVIDYHLIFDGQEDLEHKIHGFPIEIGSNVMIPGFEDGLIGTKAGDTRTLNLQFPADYQVQERAGKPVDFVIEVKQVFEAVVPVMNPEFMQQLGIKSGEQADLEKQIRQTLEHERTRLVNNHLKEKVFGELLEQNSLEIPTSLIEREAKNIHDEIYQRQPHDHDKHTAEETATFNDIAKKRVTLGLLIGEYARQAQLKPDAERVTARIKEIASAYETPADVITWLSSDERRSDIENQVLEEQVLEKLMENSTITEKPMSYAELKALQQSSR